MALFFFDLFVGERWLGDEDENVLVPDRAVAEIEAIFPVEIGFVFIQRDEHAFGLPLSLGAASLVWLKDKR